MLSFCANRRLDFGRNCNGIATKVARIAFPHCPGRYRTGQNARAVLFASSRSDACECGETGRSRGNAAGRARQERRLSSRRRHHAAEALGNAAYPPDALAAGVDGTVVAEILVNDAGIVSDARVLKSVPPLDEAALKAVREWRYDPTIVDGKAVPVRMTVTVSFTRR